MNRRFFSLLVLLIVGLAVWFTSRWWLPWLLDLLPFIEANSDLIQAIEALVNIAWLLFSAVIGYLLWLSRPGAKPQADRDLQDAILTQVSVARLLEELGQGANLNWIDRGAVRPADLRLHGRVVITGRSGLGKTREAIELIRRTVDDDLVLPDRISRPGPALRFVPPEAIASQLARSFDPHLPALLFVDDLPYHFTGEGLIRLARLIDALSQGKALFVVATARSDQLTPEHDGWLGQQRFHTFALSNLAADGIARLVDSAAGLFSLQVPHDAVVAFAEHSDGTAQHPLIALRLLRQQGRERISADDARSALSDSAVQAWAETRRYITDPQRAPAAAYILDALAHFHVARLTAYHSLVIPYAMHLAHSNGALRSHRRKRTLEQALAFLSKFEVRTVDRVIHYRDEIGAFAPSQDAVLEQLAAFFAGHRRFMHRRLWRVYIRSTAEQIAAELELSSISFSLGKYADAIAANQRAIALDTKSATPHNSLGIKYGTLGRHEEAIGAFQQAIALDATFALPHCGLGNVFSALGRHEEALAAYQRSYQLQPRANPLIRLGTLYRSLERYRDAIDVLQQVIDLGSNDPTIWSSLAGIYRKLGDDSSYHRHIALAQPFMVQESEYNRACFASVSGDLDEALTLLEAAIAKAPVDRISAQHDPDFDFIRDDPRFRALVGEQEQA